MLLIYIMLVDIVLTSNPESCTQTGSQLARWAGPEARLNRSPRVFVSVRAWQMRERQGLVHTGARWKVRPTIVKCVRGEQQ
jgi:hypothetical protein